MSYSIHIDTPQKYSVVLDDLITLDETNKKKIITQHASDCFINATQNKIGLLHTTEKVLWGTGVVAGTGAAIVGVPLVAGYLYLSSKASELTIWDTPSVLFKTLLAVPTALVAKRAFRTVRPLLYLGALVAANEIYKSATASYTLKEERSKQTGEDLHYKIIEEQEGLFKGLAQELGKRFNAAKNNPEEMYKIKQFADSLDKKIPLIKSALEHVDIKSDEAVMLMENFTKTVAMIKDCKLNVKAGDSKDAGEYNLKLMEVLKPEAFAGNCISTEVDQHLHVARQNVLDFRHTIKQVVDTAVKGSATCAGVTLGATIGVLTTAAFVHTGTSQALSKNMWAVAGPSLAGGIYLGLKRGKDVFEGHTKDRILHEERFASNVESATAKLTKVYNGMAAALLDQFAKAKAGRNNSAAIVKMQERADALQDKLAIVDKKIAGNSELTHPAAITANFKDALKQILSIKNAQSFVARSMPVAA